MTYTQTKIIRPSDIYGCRPHIPSGLKVVAFRPTRPGDIFLAKSGVVIWDAGVYADDPPRLILETVLPCPEDWWE